MLALLPTCRNHSPWPFDPKMLHRNGVACLLLVQAVVMVS
jgi:hypothetical protein